MCAELKIKIRERSRYVEIEWNNRAAAAISPTDSQQWTWISFVFSIQINRESLHSAAQRARTLKISDYDTLKALLIQNNK